MKKPVFLLLFLLQLTACTIVRFDSPQPADAIALPEFPEKMRGLFVSEDQDTLEVTITGFHFRNGEEIQLRGDLTMGEAVLKEIKNYYILNLQEEGEWDVFPVRLRKGDIHIYFPATASRAEELMEEIKQTSSVIEILDADGDFDHYLIDPTPEEFQFLIRKNFFDERIIFKRIE